MGLFRKSRELPVRSPQTQEDSYAFRRSRTLTGSASEEVRSASESRAQLKSPRLKEHELRSHRRRLGTYFLGVTGVIAVLVGLLYQYVGITSLRVQSQNPLVATVDETRYHDLINAYFSQHPAERFRFALNEQSLRDYLGRHAPEVESIIFEQSGLASAHADIRFRTPVVVWQLSGKRSYVDGQGHAFEKNYYNEPSVAVKDDSGLQTSSGTVVSDRFLQFMGRVIALTNASGTVRITGATLPRGYAREIDYTVEGRGYYVKSQLGRDAASQAADIINAVKYMDEKGLKPQYVDVRIAGKAVYR